MEVKQLQINACAGFYIGTVIQHLPHGQLKVFIPQIHSEEWRDKPEMLPICMQVTPQFGGSNTGNGVFSYPNIGSTVMCGFANNDQNYPFTIGSILGGENAFGQYEWIKNPDEEISKRHLVTSGKSHIEFYENGKISAVVYDPIRTDAKVEYNNKYQAQKNDDKVSSREICEKVDSEEISNINCQTVLDNNINNGEISSSTHYFNPISKTDTQILSAEQTTVIKTFNGEERNDHYEMMNNVGHNIMSDVSSYNLTFTQNTTCIPKQTTEQIVIVNKLDNGVENVKNIDCDNQMNMSTKSTNSSNYAFYDNTDKTTIISSDTIKSEIENKQIQNKNGSYGFTYSNDFDEKYLYTNSKTLDNITKSLKEEKTSNIYEKFDDDNNEIIDLTTKKTSNLIESYIKKGILLHKNKHNVNDSIVLHPEQSIKQNAEWHDNDQLSMTGVDIQEIHDNIGKIDVVVNDNKKVKLALFSHDKWKKIINSHISKYDTQCNIDLNPSEGFLEIQILNNDLHEECTINMDNNGKIKVYSTVQIDIQSPIINMTGNTLTQTFKNIIQKGSTVNITGSNGDVKIKNVSLLNHMHQEMQSGDVVVPGSTKTATASN